MSEDLETDLRELMARRAHRLGNDPRIDPLTSLQHARGALMRTRLAITIAAAIAVVGVGFGVANMLGEDPVADPPVAIDPEPQPPALNELAVPVYFPGDTPRGLRLYREFRVVETADPLTTAVDLAVSGTPLDPDYTAVWPDGVSATASYDGDVLTVDLADAPAGLRDRPSGMSQEEGAMAIEQVIFTAQAALGEGRVPVQFLLEGQRSDQILGQPVSEPLANGPLLNTLSHVNLTTPSQRDTVTDSLRVSGVANSFEANVVVTLQRLQDTEVVFQEGVMAEGWMGEQLFPFEQTFDVSGVQPGSYVLTAMTDDPSGGEEGFGPFSDTKLITIE